MSDPNWHPTWTDTEPVSQPRCPPCNGDCLQGRTCDAPALVETPAGGLVVMVGIIVAVLSVIAAVVWPR